MRSPRTHSTRKLPGFIGLIALLCSALLGLSGHAASYKIDRPAIQIDRLDQDEISKRSSGSGSADFVVPEFLHLAKLDSAVGYIRGSNDSLPEILNKVGIDVEVIEISDIPQTDLKHYSAILIGPYAYSLSGDAKAIGPRLLSYAREGGLLVTQNQADDYPESSAAPYPFRQQLSKQASDRAFELTEPGHKAFNFPNRLDDIDLEQLAEGRSRAEVDSWDSKYQPLIRTSEGNVEILLTDYGKGNFIYSTRPFSSEVEAGNQASLRLFVNLISLQSSARNGNASRNCSEVEFGFNRGNGTFSNFGCDGAPRNC